MSKCIFWCFGYLACFVLFYLICSPISCSGRERKETESKMVKVLKCMFNGSTYYCLVGRCILIDGPAFLLGFQDNTNMTSHVEIGPDM